MKTIIIQSSVPWTGKSKFKVTVNGGEHIMKEKFLYVNVDVNAGDKTPLELSAKRGWYSSAVFEFEPKDNLNLQISINQRLRNRVLVWVIIMVVIAFITAYILEYFIDVGRASSFLPLLSMAFPLADLIFSRKKFFTISEK